MRHNVKKIKFNFGRDANRMLMRKLAVNFLNHGYLQTTLSKAKALKPYIEKLVSKMKANSEANKNFLLRNLGDVKVVADCFKRVGPALAKINGGYVRIIKQGNRNDDGAPLAKVEWAYPVVKESASTKVTADKGKKTEVKVKEPASVKTTAGK